MVQKQWLLAGLLALSLFVAGCTSNGEVEVPASEGDGGSTNDPAGGTAWTAASAHRFTPEPATNTTLYEEGSFSPADYCLAFGCVADNVLGMDQYGHSVDLSDEIPGGVPTLLEANFHLGDNGIYNLSLDAGGSEVYWIEYDHDAGRIQLEALVHRGDEDRVELVISPQFPLPFSDPQTEFPWTLVVNITSRPEHLPPGSAVMVPLSEGTHALNFTAIGGTAEWTLWDGADNHLARNKTSDTLHYMIPDDAARDGAFVVYVQPDSAPLLINATGPDPRSETLDILTVSWLPIGEPQPLEPESETAWTFELDRVPIATGVGIDFDDVIDNGNAEIRVSSPRTSVLETQVGCYICVGYEFRAQSEPGDPAHVLGTYEVKATTSLNTPLELQIYTITYER